MALCAFSSLNIAKKCHYQNVRLISSFIYHNSAGVDKKSNFFVKKFTELNELYVKFIGLDELKNFQDRVITTQIKLEKAQEERRQIGNLLNEVRKRANDLLEQLHKVDRSNDRQRYVDLTVKETEEFQKGQELAKQFEELDKAEREIFTSLCNAVRDSHEKERAQAEYTKYFGIILSIVGTFFGAILSMIINTFRTRELIGGIEEGIEKKINLVGAQMISLDNKISTMLALPKSSKQNDQNDVQPLLAEMKNEYINNLKPIVDIVNRNQKQIEYLISHINNLSKSSVPVADGFQDNLDFDKLKQTITKYDVSSTFESNKYQIILGLAILLVAKIWYFG